MTPLNGCSSCGSNFTSVTLFDFHRVGVHAYTYSEGVAMDPIREDGRRCLSAKEMLERGWAKDDKCRWFDPVSVDRARVRFGATRTPLGTMGVDAEAIEAPEEAVTA